MSVLPGGCPMIGKKLGPYEILSAIGSGGMGEVWKARDTYLNVRYLTHN
jgi:serine/threonine protein kinase